MAKMFSFILVATALIMGKESWALEDCAQEQARLRAQVHLLETRVKQQQVKITHLLQEKEVQLLDKGEESSVIHIGGKRQYADCSEVFNDGYKLSGFYKIKPLQSPAEFSVYCDMSDGGGWTVIQRRSDGSENFNRGWNDYENGFGNFVQKHGEYWLGNKNLHLLTTQGNETNSIIALGDSLAGNFIVEWASHQRIENSKDMTNYEGNLRQREDRCHSANLNGFYYSGPYTAKTDNGIVWYTWHGWWYSLKSVVMKIRPNDFIANVV
uniref:Fibrinogen-like protein 1 n=1 Tax=Aotus nancymaae TaxID=37293 RepID=A0A2K5CRH1_AOTNA